MWKTVARGEWPYWAVEGNALWKHGTGMWLSSKNNDASTLWELRNPEGVVMINQLDLPFKGGLDGAPLVWADAEMARQQGRK